MALELAPQGPNESAKEARERRQKAMIEAWNEWDKKEADAIAQEEALDEQTPLTHEQELARQENVRKQSEASAKKARIEEEWREEFKCPFKRSWAEIEQDAKDAQDESLIEDTLRPDGPEGTAREQIQDLKAQTYMHAAQELLENKFLPQDLRGGSKQKSAAQLVRPDLAAELPSASAQEELTAYADQVQPIYDRLSLGYEAARDMEKGVVIGKAGETLSEAIRNPSRLGHAFAALAGAGILLYLAKDFSSNSTFKNFVLGAVGVTALGYGGWGAVKGTDLFNKATDIRSDALLASDAMKTARTEVAARMGTKDSAQVDDMIRTFDSPIESYADAYLSALANHSNSIDLTRLGGDNGLSEKEMGYANKTSIKKNGDWLFMECYKMGVADGKITATGNADAQRAAGAAYAKKEFAGLNVGTIVLARDMVAAGMTEAPEYAVSNPKLRELLDKDAAFRAVVKPTGLPDIYTIKGAPVRFNYTDTGDYVFHDILNDVDLTRVSGKLSGDALSSTLLRVAGEGSQAMKAALGTEFASLSANLQYKEGSSHWEVVPPLSRAMPAGLPTYGKERKVYALFYYDVKDKVLRPGLDYNNDGVVDPHEPPLTTVDEVTHEYERKSLEVRIPQDISSTMLVDFTVESYQDVGTTTEVTIRYGTGSGKLVYSGDELSSYTLNPTTKELEDRWTEGAEYKQAEFLGDQRVQAALLRATTAYTGYNDSLMAGIVDKFLGMGKGVVDWVMNDSIANKFASEWEEQVIRKMIDIMYNPVTGFNKLYVDGVYKKFHRNDKFQAAEDVFMNAQIASLEGSGVLMAKVVPLQGPDMDIEWTDLTGLINERARGPLTTALAPFRNETPTPSSSLSWTLVNGAINFATQNTVREDQFDKLVSARIAKIDAALHALRTPPAKVSQNDLKDAIEKEVVAAQMDAVTYWGKNDQQAIEGMMLAPLKSAPAYAKWEAPTKKIISYMNNNMKWETYGILPSPENLGEIMEVWYAKIDNAATFPTNDAEAEKYADYFIWQTWLCFGGNQDYSLDRFNGGDTISSVSDTRFQARITKFKTIDDYKTFKGSPAVYPIGIPAGMESDLEQYKVTAKAQMEAWFVKQNDIQVWSRIYRWGPDMFKWPEVYKESFDRRLAEIITRHPSIGTSQSTSAALQKDLRDFQDFITIEQHMIYEPLIMAGAVPETDYLGLGMPFSVLVEQEITKDWAKTYFYPASGVRDLNGYKEYVKKNMARVLDAKHHFPPNMPGIPFYA